MDKNLKINISINSETAKLDALNSKVLTVKNSFINTDKILKDFKDKIDIGTNLYIGYQSLNNTLGAIARTGFETNRTMQNLTNSLTTLRAVSASNVDSMGNQLTIQQKYNMAQVEGKEALQELIKINGQTPHSLNETAKIYDAMYLGMKKVGASSEDMIDITKKISIAAGNRMNFDALLSAMDGLSTGTVETASDMGRFLKSIGLSNEAIKSSSNVIQLFKDKLSGFQAIDSFDTRISNLNNSFATLSGTLTKPFFDSFSKSMIPATELLNNLNIKLEDYYNNINKVQDIHKQNNVVTLKDELGELEKKLDSAKESSKRFYNEWTTHDEAEINKLELLIKTTKNKIKDLENPNKPKLVDAQTTRDDISIIKIMGTEYQKLNLDIDDNVKKLKEAGATQGEIDKFRATSIKDFNEKQSKENQKLFKEKEKTAEESAKKIAEVEAEFALVGLNEWDTKFKELDNKYNADLVKYKDVIGAKEKLDAIYADNVKNLSNQKNIEAQKEDLSFFERKIQLQDDSLSKELELQGISYSSRVLEIENTTKSLAEKDKLIAKETELFDLTIQNMNYKYDTEFQDTMSNFYDDMLDSQLALNNAVFDFGAGFDGVSSKIGAISKSLAAVGTLELTNKREASKLDKKYIEQFNEYAGDITKTAKLEQQYIKDTALLKEQNLQAQINGYANVASAMSGMFEQGSREAAAFQMVESGLAVVAGIRAILTQGSGDPYTAFARMAVMAASVASLLSSAKVAFNIGNMKTSETSDYLSGMQQNTGTGTVLGDTTATSESIVQSLELLADYKKPEFDTLQSMNKYLANISNSIGGVSALIVQTGGYAFGEGFESTDTGWKNKISADSNAIKTAGFGTSALQDYIASTGGALGGATIVALGTMLVDKFLLGGTINNLTNKILGGIFGKTSVSTKLKDSGMYFADQLLSNAKDEIYGSMYQTIQTTTTKKSWFKKSTTTDTKTKLQDMEGFTETERQFSLILNNMYNSVVTAADALDTSFNDIVYKLDNFVVSIGMVSMKGLSGQQIQDKLMAIFGKVGDQLSTTVFPLLRPFQQVGEGMYTTMTRVATGMEIAEYYASRLGSSYKDISYWQLQNTQGNVGFEALLQIIQNTEKATSGANTNFIQLINSLDTTAEELYGTYTTLDKLRSTLTYIKLGVDTISFASIKGAGSADALVAGVNAYIDGFLDESEQLALNTNLLQKEFSKLNLALPNGKQNFRNLIESIDKTSESGQGLWGSLIVLSDSFATVADSTKESIDTLTSSLEELNTNQFDTFISSLNNIGSSIKNVKNTALGFIQGLSTSSSASLEEQLISYNKMRDEFNNYFENGVIKSGVNQDSVSNLYSQISSLASNIAGQDDYLKNSLVNQFKDDITSFNFAEDILKVSIVEGLGYLEGLSSQQINQLKYVLDDGKITIAELNSINGLSQIQKDNILKFANNSDYFSTENTLTSLEDYAQQQLSLMKDNSEKDTSSLSATSFEYGNHIGLQEQIDISKLLGVSYGTAKPLIEQLQELSISTDKTKTLNNILGWKDTDTSYDLTKANQISALAPYIEGADVSAYLTNIASASQQNLLSKQALEKFEAAKAKFNAELLGYETELNSRVSQIGSLQAGYDYWKRKDEGDGEGKKYKPAKDAARAAINDNNANIAKLQALIPQLYQQKTLNGFINGSGNILDDQLAWFNKREIVTPPAFSDGIRSGELSLGNNNEIVAAIESLKKITTEQAKLIQKMADALEEFNNRDLIKTAKGAA